MMFKHDHKVDKKTLIEKLIYHIESREFKENFTPMQAFFQLIDQRQAKKQKLIRHCCAWSESNTFFLDRLFKNNCKLDVPFKRQKFRLTWLKLYSYREKEC